MVDQTRLSSPRRASPAQKPLPPTCSLYCPDRRIGLNAAPPPRPSLPGWSLHAPHRIASGLSPKPAWQRLLGIPTDRRLLHCSAVQCELPARTPDGDRRQGLAPLLAWPQLGGLLSGVIGRCGRDLKLQSPRSQRCRGSSLSGVSSRESERRTGHRGRSSGHPDTSQLSHRGQEPCPALPASSAIDL